MRGAGPPKHARIGQDSEHVANGPVIEGVVVAYSHEVLFHFSNTLETSYLGPSQRNVDRGGVVEEVLEVLGCKVALRCLKSYLRIRSEIGDNYRREISGRFFS